MGEFNSDDHYIYDCGQESLRRNEVAIIVNKSPKCSTWMQSQKLQNDLCFQGEPFNITVIQVYAPTSNVEEAEVERFYEDLQDLLELTPQKDNLFIIGKWNAKVGSQELPGITGRFGLGVQNEADQTINFQMFKLDLEKAEEPEIKLPTSVGSLKKAREFQKNIYFCFIDYAKTFDCVDHNRLWLYLGHEDLFCIDLL